MKRPCLHRPQPPTLSQLGREPQRSYLCNGTKLASGSCILQRETVLRSKPQPQSIFAQEGSSWLSHIALGSP